MVTDDLCDRLGILGPSDGLILSTLNDSERLQSRRVCFSVQPVGSGGDKHEVRNAQTIPKLNVKNHHLMDWSQEKGKWAHLTDLHLLSSTHGPVDVLLGTDVIELIVPREVVKAPPGTPCAVITLPGWTVTGRVPLRASYASDEQCVHHIRVSDEKGSLVDIQNQVKQFWTTEGFGTKYEKAQLQSESDKRAMLSPDSATKRVDGR